MAIIIETMGNQFIDKDSRLYHIDTKKVIEDDSVEIVEQIEDQIRGSVKNCKKSIAP